MKTKEELIKYFGSKVTYDSFGTHLWVNESNGDMQLLADVRGWGHIQNLFILPGGSIDEESAGKFQDQIGEFIAEAINEKLRRPFSSSGEAAVTETEIEKQAQKVAGSNYVRNHQPALWTSRRDSFILGTEWMRSEMLRRSSGAAMTAEIEPEILWDEFSEHIDDDVYSFETVAGTTIMKREQFMKMFKRIFSAESPAGEGKEK